MWLPYVALTYLKGRLEYANGGVGGGGAKAWERATVEGKGMGSSISFSALFVGTPKWCFCMCSLYDKLSCEWVSGLVLDGDIYL